VRASPSQELDHDLTRRSFNGWGLTAIDALDTMIVMGFDDMVERVVSHVASIRFSNTVCSVP
jgi:hypothetical protein